jgi:hypothetical protein
MMSCAIINLPLFAEDFFTGCSEVGLRRDS